MGKGMQKHSDCKHFLVFENGRFAYLSVPHELTTSKDTELCFTDHRKDGAISEMCCRQESDHVHAHVHRGEIMEDVLLEQVRRLHAVTFSFGHVRIASTNGHILFSLHPIEEKEKSERKSDKK